MACAEEKKNENKLPRSIFGAKNVLYTLEEDLLQGKSQTLKMLSKWEV